MYSVCDSLWFLRLKVLPALQHSWVGWLFVYLGKSCAEQDKINYNIILYLTKANVLHHRGLVPSSGTETSFLVTVCLSSSKHLVSILTVQVGSDIKLLTSFLLMEADIQYMFPAHKKWQKKEIMWAALLIASHKVRNTLQIFPTRHYWWRTPTVCLSSTDTTDTTDTSKNLGRGESHVQ